MLRLPALLFGYANGWTVSNSGASYAFHEQRPWQQRSINWIADQPPGTTTFSRHIINWCSMSQCQLCLTNFSMENGWRICQRFLVQKLRCTARLAAFISSTFIRTDAAFKRHLHLTVDNSNAV